jgi:hypothetical protein
MISPEDIFRQIESDRAVREREIRLMGNVARNATTANERETLFRSSVLLTYAHLEGFCRFAFGAYVSAINSLELYCEEASYEIVAVSLTRIFGALRHPQTKHHFFANRLPDDAKLHLTAREREFIENFSMAMRLKVEVPDNVIDTESNLSSIVLMKNLYKLGLKYNSDRKQNGQIDKLLGVRNAIAHGDILKKPSSDEVDEYVTSAFGVMSFVQTEIFNALNEGAYRRTPQPLIGGA